MQARLITTSMLVASLGLSACSGESTPVKKPDPVEPDCENGTKQLADGSCQKAGIPAGQCHEGFAAGSSGGCEPILPSTSCPRGTKAQIGSEACEPVGVPADGCSSGFATDKEGGCTPILPDAPCPDGTLAVPGDTVCHEVMPCGQSLWGEAPLDATAQLVDAAYDVTKGPSDGTAAHPWTTIQAGIDAAAMGAVVAITDGSYHENLVLHAHPVRLWGRCPTSVEIVGTVGARSTLDIMSSPGVEVHGVALRGAADVSGVGVYGSSSVVLDRLWIHDHDARGVYAEPGAAATSLTLTGSLVERARDQGMVVTLGAQAEVNRSVIRDMQPRADQTFGRALGVQSGVSAAKRSSVLVKQSVLERNHDVNVLVVGADAVFEGTVLRDTQPQASGQERGWGIGVQADPTSKQQGDLTLTGCWIGNNHDLGLFVSGSHATLHRTVIRNTLSHLPDLLYGQAIEVTRSSAAGQPSLLAVEESLIADNRTLAVSITGSDATFETTIVRGTLPEEADQIGGRGIEAGYHHDTKSPSTLSLKHCLLEDNRDAALFLWGSTATIEDTTLRGTLAAQSSSSAGRAIEAQNEPNDGVASSVTLLRALVEDNHEAGVFISGSKLMADSSVVRRTLVDEATGQHGYGVVVVAEGASPGQVVLTGSLLDANHDAGLLLVGSKGDVVASTVRGTLASPKGGLGDGLLALMGADLHLTSSEVHDNVRAGAAALESSLTLQSTLLSCNAVSVTAATYADEKDNACGCDATLVTCAAETTELESPALPVLPRLKVSD